MDQPNTQPADAGQTLAAAGLILSNVTESGLTLASAEAELVSMRQMMETLFARVESLQQNQAVQFSGVNDRLDAVELEMPLIQEQSALRIRDLENRISVEMEEAARSAAEEVAAGIRAGLQQEVAGKFGSLAALIEGQQKELAQMRDSKKLTESKLSQAVEDIERLCGALTPRVVEPQRAIAESQGTSPSRRRIAEHIRKAAVEAAPDESNPLVADTPPKKRVADVGEMSPATAGPVGQVTEPIAPAMAAMAPAEPAPVAPAPVPDAVTPRPVTPDSPVPGFDDWKRRFMQSGAPLIPTLNPEGDKNSTAVVCPRCYSDRTRPATRTRFDTMLRIAGFSPHRCRSCSHRFYKRGPVVDVHIDDDNPDAQTEEALGAR